MMKRKFVKRHFNTLETAVDKGLFGLLEETFFNTPRHYRDFAEFEKTIINATHSCHRLDETNCMQRSNSVLNNTSVTKARTF